LRAQQEVKEKELEIEKETAKEIEKEKIKRNTPRKI
jgi:hypothetical protein